jgi:hypothetical protein
MRFKDLTCEFPQTLSLNPKGIPTYSPGLLGTSYPGKNTIKSHNPVRVAQNSTETQLRRSSANTFRQNSLKIHKDVTQN